MLTSFTPVHCPGVGRTMTIVRSKITGQNPECILTIHWIYVDCMTRNRTTSQNYHPRTKNPELPPARREEETDGPTSKVKRKKNKNISLTKNRHIFQNRRSVTGSEVRTCLLMFFYHYLLCLYMHCSKIWRVWCWRWKSSWWRPIDAPTSELPGNVTASTRWPDHHLRGKSY